MSNTTTDASTLAQGINFDEWRLHKQRSSSLFLTFFQRVKKHVRGTGTRPRLHPYLLVFSVFPIYMCIGMFHQDNYAYFMHLCCVHAIITKWWWTQWWRRWWSSSKPFKCTFEVYSIPRYTFIYTEWEQPKFIEFNVRCSLVCERAFRTIVEFQCLLCARFSLCVNCFYDYLFVRSFVWRSLPPPLLIEYTHKT